MNRTSVRLTSRDRRYTQIGLHNSILLHSKVFGSPLQPPHVDHWLTLFAVQNATATSSPPTAGSASRRLSLFSVEALHRVREVWTANACAVRMVRSIDECSPSACQLDASPREPIPEHHVSDSLSLSLSKKEALLTLWSVQMALAMLQDTESWNASSLTDAPSSEWNMEKKPHQDRGPQGPRTLTVKALDVKLGQWIGEEIGPLLNVFLVPTGAEAHKWQDEGLTFASCLRVLHATVYYLSLQFAERSVADCFHAISSSIVSAARSHALESSQLLNYHIALLDMTSSQKIRGSSPSPDASMSSPSSSGHSVQPPANNWGRQGTPELAELHEALMRWVHVLSPGMEAEQTRSQPTLRRPFPAGLNTSAAMETDEMVERMNAQLSTIVQGATP